jgi:hypothetical protein
MRVKEVIADQYLRILALEETIGKLEMEKSILQEKVIQLTPPSGAVGSQASPTVEPSGLTGSDQ